VEIRYREFVETQDRESELQRAIAEKDEQLEYSRKLIKFQEEFWCHHKGHKNNYSFEGALPRTYINSINEYDEEKEVRWDTPENMFKCKRCSEWFCFNHMGEDAWGNPGRGRGDSPSRTGYCFECAVARREVRITY
jgi:hypothetical protein